MLLTLCYISEVSKMWFKANLIVYQSPHFISKKIGLLITFKACCQWCEHYVLTNIRIYIIFLSLPSLLSSTFTTAYSLAFLNCLWRMFEFSRKDFSVILAFLLQKLVLTDCNPLVHYFVKTMLAFLWWITSHLSLAHWF